jgi:hypothetical protein
MIPLIEIEELLHKAIDMVSPYYGGPERTNPLSHFHFSSAKKN